MRNPKWLFPASTVEAKQIQEMMVQHVVIADLVKKPITYIAGLDVSNNRFDPKKMLYAAAVVLEYPSLKVVETATMAEKQTFPYIPGLLGFREAPVLIHAFKKLSITPDIILVDGHGISHPHGLGIASHLGVLLNIPTIGVAKSILVGAPVNPLDNAPGSQTPLTWNDKTIGMLLRTKKGSLPLIISAGHQVTLASALKLVSTCLKGYRLTEPTRQAHLAANACRIAHQANCERKV